MAPEAPLERRPHGLVPAGAGWYVLNAREAAWEERGGRGLLCDLEGDAPFPQLGINLRVLEPGEPMAMYHWEADQEEFLVLAGEALLIVEDRERPLRAWDFVHCPAGVDHVIVGAGSGPCVVLAVGARERSTGPEWGGYTVSPAAVRRGAGVGEATNDPERAYARFQPVRPAAYRHGLLPD
jgi:uncharacterized cupin superfamily protein